MKSMFFLLIFLVFGCAKPIGDYLEGSGNAPSNRTHPDFSYYKSLFNMYFDTKSTTPIIYGVENDKYAGVCYFWSNGYREIKINKNHWANYNESQREVLIFHELAHCEFDLSHDDNKSGYCPYSIMRSYMFSKYEVNACYELQKDWYIEDIINKRNE